MKSLFLRKVSLLIVGFLLSTNFLMANANEWPEKLTFGLIPVAGSSSMKENFEPIRFYLEETLGVKVILKLSNDYTGTITGMQYGHIDFAYFGPKSYVEAARRAKAEAIVQEVDAESGLPGYTGLIITKKGSNLKSLDDIKGKKWAFTSSQSTSGTLVPTVMFSKKNIDPQKYFSKVVYSGGHEASILAIKSGNVDAASTNNLDYNRGLGKQWNESDFNIIWKSELIPGSPMAVRADLPLSLKVAIKGAFLSFRDKESLEKLKINGYIDTTDSVYDSIRELIELKKKLKKK